MADDWLRARDVKRSPDVRFTGSSDARDLNKNGGHNVLKNDIIKRLIFRLITLIVTVD